MPSTYSQDLRIELIAAGEQSGTWGSTTNNNLGNLIEDAISGAVVITIDPGTGVQQAILAANGAIDQARCSALVLTGATDDFEIFAPPVTKIYVIRNECSFQATLWCATTINGTTAPIGASGYIIPANKTVLVHSPDGVQFYDAMNYLNSALPANSGGTGFQTYAVGDLLYANTTTSLAKLADVATGNALISGGVNTAPAWGKVGLTTHVTGVLDETNGGTGQSTIPALSVLVANTLNTLTPVTVTAGQSVKLNSGGTAWEAYTPSGAGSVTFTGTVPVAQGQVTVFNDTSGTSITTARTYQFRATSAGPAQIQLFEDTDSGADAITIQPPATLASSYTLTLPTTDGSASQLLQTDGSGVLTWATITAGTGITVTPASGSITIAATGGGGTGDVVGPSSATNNAIVRFDATTGKLIQNSVVTISDTGAATGFTTLNASSTITGNGFVSSTGAYNFTASAESIFGSTGLVSIAVGGSARIDVTISDFLPDGDNNMGLGSSGKRWTAVYAVNGTIQTSDANSKQDIADLDDAERRVAARIKGLIKKFRFKDAVATKGDAARIHVGVIAQEVRDAFTAEGLDADRYGMFCSDTWWEREEDVYQPFNGTTVRKKVIHKTPVESATEVTQLGVRYDELLAFVIAAM